MKTTKTNNANAATMAIIAIEVVVVVVFIWRGLEKRREGQSLSIEAACF
jgi:hypothetical protein